MKKTFKHRDEEYTIEVSEVTGKHDDAQIDQHIQLEKPKYLILGRCEHGREFLSCNKEEEVLEVQIDDVGAMMEAMIDKFKPVKSSHAMKVLQTLGFKQ